MRTPSFDKMEKFDGNGWVVQRGGSAHGRMHMIRGMAERPPQPPSHPHRRPRIPVGPGLSSDQLGLGRAWVGIGGEAGLESGSGLDFRSGREARGLQVRLAKICVKVGHSFGEAKLWLGRARAVIKADGSCLSWAERSTGRRGHENTRARARVSSHLGQGCIPPLLNKVLLTECQRTSTLQTSITCSGGAARVVLRG